ncbi:MAG: hypothetical protein ACI30H_01050 [Paludibacteraceae bacterium]
MKRIDILKNVLLTATMVGAGLSVIITIRGVMADADNQRTPLSGISYSASPVSDTSSKSGGSTHRVSGGDSRRAAADVLPTVNPAATHRTVAVSAPSARPMAVAAVPSGAKMATANLVSERTSSAASAGGVGSAASAGVSRGSSAGGYSATPTVAGCNAVNVSKSSSVSEPFADTRPSSTIHPKWDNPTDPNLPPPETPIGDGIWFLLVCASGCMLVKWYTTTQTKRVG